MSAEAWIEITSDGRANTLVELVIRDDKGDEARYFIPNVMKATVELTRKGTIATLEVVARTRIRAIVRTDAVSAEDLLAEIAADRLVGKTGGDGEDS